MAKRAAQTCLGFWERRRNLVGVALLTIAVGVVASGDALARAGTALSLAPAVGSEVASLRTADSSTFVGPNGALVAHVYSTPVNYRDFSGAWQPIDNTLVADPGGYANAANRFQVQLPSMLGLSPVRVSDGSKWVSFSLDGGTGLGGVASGSSETYAAALPGVNVTDTATGWGLKEDAVLLGPSSPRSLSFTVSTSAGLTPVQASDGSIEFVARAVARRGSGDHRRGIRAGSDSGGRR